MFIMGMKYLLIRDTITRRSLDGIQLIPSAPPPLPLLLRSTILISGGESPSAVVRVILKERCVSLSSGIATQTILTIPVSHVTNNQMVNLALSNGQVVSTTLANLQSLAQPQNMLNTPTSNGK